MSKHVILSVTGSDRPGLTKALADAIHAAGGNWLESNLSRLGGKYVGAVLVEIEPDALSALAAEVGKVDSSGLHVAVVSAGPEPDEAEGAMSIELVGQDRPGIIREVTSVLAAIGANIDSLTTATENGAWSGERLFRANVSATLPEGVTPEAVQHALEAISRDVMVDFTFG